ncbi:MULTISPECIES: helix-turn-helix domain-containing protein [Sphingobacterium]|uniref:helix-turn-helix domain-containing protein n=1 Tax=Sphingobacterium TaxID=28453 RepID=UPI00104E14DD|nr:MULTISPECIES: helix-turn-helix domain-containing protein [Sphingobacterium]MCW2259741.1 AraC-like DNA-binding protein [Sphingobacterium kitahiroshimense]TCR03419.1 AraC family transcriptional regulator [Sphingobacterium sp. JUb78]
MIRYKTISEWFEAWQMPKPEHPLISVFYIDTSRIIRGGDTFSSFCDFYCIALKRVTGVENLQLKYGQNSYDFNEGVMSFVSPGQVTTISVEKDIEVKQSGWYLVIHPDFLWNTPLANSIKRYDFWDYTVNESLFLSEKEEDILIQIIENVHRETHANIDKYSKQIILSLLESLLNYAERFYNRQFVTREKANHQILDRLEKVLNDYLNSGQTAVKGVPSVTEIAALLNISPKYLSGLLRMHTGQNTQYYIHEKLIEKAKERISTSDLSISEIAYELGFEHLQSFSRLFKAKTNLSPVEFRQSFKN